MDRIDRALFWTIQLSLVVLFVTLPDTIGSMMATAVVSSSSDQNENDNDDHDDDTMESQVGNSKAFEDFFFGCSGGKLWLVKEELSKHPDWVHARTNNGETCLHLNGIYGHTDLTRYLLEEAGADPNVRSTYEQGLRMHPLSWNVYGGHYDTIALLLKHGANVNLPFDGMGDSGPVTALDVVLQLVENEAGDDRFAKIEKLLREHGAKTMKELQAADGGDGHGSDINDEEL